MSIINTLNTMIVNLARTSANRPKKSWTSLWLFLAALGTLANGLAAHAVTREITITAPTTAVAGSKVLISVAARTDAGAGERIGFLHADYSTDGGLTWTAITYTTNVGPKTSSSATIAVKQADTKVLIRVRVAFRGGKDGDVDFTGKKIDWEGSWNKWQEPPAKIASIAILAK